MRTIILGYKQIVVKTRLYHSRDEEENSLGDFCDAVAGVNSQFSAVIDLTWNGWDDVATKCKVCWIDIIGQMYKWFAQLYIRCLYSFEQYK